MFVCSDTALLLEIHLRSLTTITPNLSPQASIRSRRTLRAFPLHLCDALLRAEVSLVHSLSLHEVLLEILARGTVACAFIHRRSGCVVYIGMPQMRSRLAAAVAESVAVAVVG